MTEFTQGLTDLQLVLYIVAIFFGVFQMFLLLGWAIRGQRVSIWLGIVSLLAAIGLVFIR